ncbi:MAG: carbohydrate binding domain-containing protein, partial [Armatimonadetes bacterium]|nr:carbohydrate binding domain-containing protein [Armatimonadota bacterium]
MYLLATVIFLSVAGQKVQQANMVPNGSFEVDADGDGIADQWTYAPGTSSDSAPTTKLFRDKGRHGDWCQAIQCTRFERGHVMLAQTGTVGVEQGKTYEITFWARGEDIGQVNVGLQETRTWQHLGLWRSFRPPRRWRWYRYVFTANRTAHETTRLQFWYTGTGTLYIDDVVLRPTEPPSGEYIICWPSGSKNCLLNSSFELGTAGWLTYGYWRLYGEVVEDKAAHGQRCLRIAVDPAKVPVSSFDYYEPTSRPIDVLAVASRHWIRLERGVEYTL